MAANVCFMVLLTLDSLISFSTRFNSVFLNVSAKVLNQEKNIRKWYFIQNHEAKDKIKKPDIMSDIKMWLAGENILHHTHKFTSFKPSMVKGSSTIFLWPNLNMPNNRF